MVNPDPFRKRPLTDPGCGEVVLKFFHAVSVAQNALKVNRYVA
jgi:hypothetical protein